jgi:hypothetical protein
VNFPAANSNNFLVFHFANIGNMATVNFSGWTGTVIGTGFDFVCWALLATTSLTFGFSLINCRDFIVRRNLLLNFYITPGLVARPVRLFDVSMNAISAANVNAMIADVNTHQALFANGVRFNFSRSSAFVNNVTNTGTNGVPSAGSIATMAALAAGPKAFEFMYWNGASNVLVT